MAKSERMFDMLQLIADNPGEFGPKDLAEQLDVSERGIYRYLNTLTNSGIMVRTNGTKKYSLSEDYWVHFLTKFRQGHLRQKKSLIQLLIIAVDAAETETLREKGREFLRLLGVEDVG